MKQNFLISSSMTVATTVLLGVIYPLVVTVLAQWIFPRQANGELISVAANAVGSSLIGQPFSSAGYFHPRPSGGARRIRSECGEWRRDEFWADECGAYYASECRRATFRAENPGAQFP